MNSFLSCEVFASPVLIFGPTVVARSLAQSLTSCAGGRERQKERERKRERERENDGLKARKKKKGAFFFLLLFSRFPFTVGIDGRREKRGFPPHTHGEGRWKKGKLSFFFFPLANLHALTRAASLSFSLRRCRHARTHARAVECKENEMGRYFSGLFQGGERERPKLEKNAPCCCWRKKSFR